MAKKKRIPHKFHPWINARKSFKLSDAHIQMARELGLSPKRFGRYADRTKEPWKLPLSEFIEALYEKQFGKTRPDVVRTMEKIAEEHVRKRAQRRTEKLTAVTSEPQVETSTEETVVQSEAELATEAVVDGEVSASE
ncbi:MAG: hypothetical protein WBD20_12960 [Pirellulaceae bacterium]